MIMKFGRRPVCLVVGIPEKTQRFVIFVVFDNTSQTPLENIFC